MVEKSLWYLTANLISRQPKVLYVAQVAQLLGDLPGEVVAVKVESLEPGEVTKGGRDCT